MTHQKMKAIVCTGYGAPEVLEVREVAKPSPKADEVLVKVFATPVTAADGMMRQGTPFFARFFIGLFKPKKAILGTGVAGKIEAVGKAVTQFKVGDAVFGETTINFGANAEYVCISEKGILLKKPAELTYAAAASFCDGPLTSISFLKEIAKIKPGQKVLINGASGSLGTAAVQLAKYYGARVTGVCGPSNQDLVRSLGADEVIDYTLEDFTKRGSTYDVIYDTVGKLSFGPCKKALRENGLFLSPVLNFSLLLQIIRSSIMGGKQAKFSATGILPIPELRESLQELKDLFEQGQLRSVIDRTYSLDEVVAAHTYVDRGHKKGNVVMTLNR